MRFPKAWPYMSSEAKKIWLQTTGKKQQEVDLKYKKNYSDYIKDIQQKKVKPSSLPF